MTEQPERSGVWICFYNTGALTLWALRTCPRQTREMSTYCPVLRYSLAKNHWWMLFQDNECSYIWIDAATTSINNFITRQLFLNLLPFFCYFLVTNATLCLVLQNCSHAFFHLSHDRRASDYDQKEYIRGGPRSKHNLTSTSSEHLNEISPVCTTDKRK